MSFMEHCSRVPFIIWRCSHFAVESKEPWTEPNRISAEELLFFFHIWLVYGLRSLWIALFGFLDNCLSARMRPHSFMLLSYHLYFMREYLYMVEPFCYARCATNNCHFFGYFLTVFFFVIFIRNCYNIVLFTHSVRRYLQNCLLKLEFIFFFFFRKRIALWKK